MPYASNYHSRQICSGNAGITCNFFQFNRRRKKCLSSGQPRTRSCCSFCVVSPQLATYRQLGSLMHDKKPADLLQAISHAATKVPSNAQGVVRAFSAGFLCHYLLDRAAHPFVYSQQYALCNAGIEGLTAKDGHEVHAVIESELDEYVLCTRTGLTVSAYKPYKEIPKSKRPNPCLLHRTHQPHDLLGSIWAPITCASVFQKRAKLPLGAVCDLFTPWRKTPDLRNG